MNLTDYDPPVDPWLDAIYADRDILVVDKPSGLLSVPGRPAELRDSVWHRALAAHPHCRVVNRLDLWTSGLMLLALRRKAESDLKRQFRERTVAKVYVARVWGRVAEDRGRVDLPLGCDWPRRPLQKVDPEEGRPAVTDYTVLDREAGSTLVRLAPVTGRSHQLRVHMQALGHPILGDPFYAHAEARAAAPRLLLHAMELHLRQPFSGDPLHFMSAPPFA